MVTSWPLVINVFHQHDLRQLEGTELYGRAQVHVRHRADHRRGLRALGPALPLLLGEPLHHRDEQRAGHGRQPAGAGGADGR